MSYFNRKKTALLGQAVISAGLAENCEYKELFAGDGEWKQIQ